MKVPFCIRAQFIFGAKGVALLKLIQGRLEMRRSPRISVTQGSKKAAISLVILVVIALVWRLLPKLITSGFHVRR